MQTVLEILNQSIGYLEKKNIVHARREAEELIGEALGLGRMGVYLEFDRPLTEIELDKCRNWLRRRGQGEPIQYISENSHFLNCDFKLTRDVLIPRQETEILVDQIIQELKSQDLKGKTLWDVCCGSGCIGISLKKRFPQLNVILSDISPKAIEITEENAKKNDVCVEVLMGDLLIPFNGQKADFIVCNPPYISEEEGKLLDIEVRNYEPEIALIAGKTGLEFYIRLAKLLPESLNPKARVWMEIGTKQGNDILKIFDDPINGIVWRSKKIEHDWAGHERFFLLEME